MMQKIKNNFFIYIVILAAVLIFSVLGTAIANHSPDEVTVNPRCREVVPWGDTTPTSPSPTGTGFIYRTMRVIVDVPSNEYDVLGGYIDRTCAVSSAWTLGGQTVYAVQAELGRKLDAHVGGALAPYPFCVPVTPTYGGPTVQGCMEPNQDYPIYQDDAAIVQVNGTTLSCIGIWPCGNIYENGISPDGRLSTNHVTSTRNVNAHRGAGFVNIPRQTLAGNGTSNIDNLSVTMLAANTFSGNFESSVLITMKYRQNGPVSCTPATQTVNTGQAATLNAGGTGPFTWSAAGGSPSSGSGTTFSTSYSTTGTRTVVVTGAAGSASCTVTVTETVICPSYTPYSSFSPMIRNVNLSLTGRPSDYGSSPWTTSGPTTSSWSTGSWSLVSSSTTSQTEQRFRSRTITTTERRYYYYYPYVYNSDGTVRTIVDSVQGTTHWPGENTPYTGGTNGSVTLDYTTHYDNYPYDQHQPVINYRVRYDNRRVTQQRTIVTTETQRQTRTRTRARSTATWGAWNTSSWSAWSSSTSTGPWSNVSSTDTSFGQSWTPTQNQNAPFMPPCFPRTYSTTASADSGQLVGDREMPTSATFSGSVRVNFSVPNTGHGVDPMRQPSRVNGIGYTLQYWIEYSDGTSSALNSAGGSPGSPLNFVASNNNKVSSSSTTTLSASISVSVPAPLRVGDRVCWRLSLPGPTTGQVGISGTPLPGASGSLNPAPVCTPRVVNWPYLKVFGNDIVSGGSFTGSCTDPAPLRARFRPGQSRGTSTQYAIFALGTVSGVRSASLRNDATTPAVGPLGLTFSNTDGSEFGGSHSANDGIGCMPDYFASRPDSTTLIGDLRPEFGDPNDDPNRIEYFETTGGYTWNPGGADIANAVQNGVRKVFYINGTLNINRNITYRGNPGPPTDNPTWNDRNNVPFIVIIARDINIAPGVTRLDGVYVAQPSGGGSGTISTCTTNYGACRNPLVINGAFFAERVNFFRTRGSLRDSVINEGRVGIVPGLSSSNTCSVPRGTANQIATNTGAAGGATCAAEVFSFSPEIYLSLSQIIIPEDTFRLDSYVTLPPNL